MCTFFISLLLLPKPAGMFSLLSPDTIANDECTEHCLYIDQVRGAVTVAGI